MEERVDKMLNEELMRQLEELSKANPGSDDARRIIDDFVELQKMAIEKQKMCMDADAKKADRELSREKAKAEEAAKAEERKNAKKQNIIQAAIQGEVLKFEKTGNIGSTVGKSLFGSIFRKK